MTFWRNETEYQRALGNLQQESPKVKKVKKIKKENKKKSKIK